MNTKLIHLLENYEQNKGNETFKEWCELESQSDPNFFRWLFDDGDLQDFSCTGHENEWQNFLNEISNILKPFRYTVEGARNNDYSVKLNYEAIISAMNDKGYNVTEEALKHNFEAWESGCKAGFKDVANGYFLYTAGGANQLYFDVEPLNGESYQQTYIA